ncbi:hypothetical protein WJX81_007437 [Elliptochloris bilobata]|uniref:histidinol-phosphate transaminase n=1 Tax=Elliptochloris bilobata TaxID=381761 RepID=A0AAW1RIV1_9CHLO
MLGVEALPGSAAREQLCGRSPPSVPCARQRPPRRARQLEAAAAVAPERQASANGATASDGSAFIRPHLRELAAYTPIEPFEVLSQRLGRRPEDIIKLDANENPYGPPPEVREALAVMPFPNIYPDPETRRLRQALAELHGLPMEHLLVGCGADELIDLLMRCVLDPGDCIVDTPPTFTMYAFDAAVNDANVLTVPRRADFSIDVPGIEAAVAARRPKLLFLTSPNNPDGSLVAEADLLRLLRLPVLVVLDEAYIEFSEERSRVAWVREHDNLVVLRTFSKSAGLAGLRVGWGAFPLALISYLWRAKQPYNVGVAAETAACAALSNPGYLQRVRDSLVEERARLAAGLAGVPYLEPYPSAANFVLCRVGGGRDAGQLRDALAQRHGIMVRHYTKPELRGFIRVSVGMLAHTDALLAALAEL